jgi:hypothetical protein
MPKKQKSNPHCPVLGCRTKRPQQILDCWGLPMITHIFLSDHSKGDHSLGVLFVKTKSRVFNCDLRSVLFRYSGTLWTTKSK